MRQAVPSSAGGCCDGPSTSYVATGHVRTSGSSKRRQCSSIRWELPCLSPELQHGRPDVRGHAGRSTNFDMWRGDMPEPRNQNNGVVPGVRTVATPLLSSRQVLDRLTNAVHDVADANFGAFYSSELGGIVTDPAYMFIHMDDHMVHRGHGVFDTALITDGHLYQLPEHIERIVQSAELAGLELPLSPEGMMRIILDTAAASRKINGMVKYWITAGRGGFGISSQECLEPGFYVMATTESKVIDRLIGWSAVTTEVSPKDPFFAAIKSNNYLQNVLLQQEAEAEGADVGLFIDSEGHLQEGPNNNLAIITDDDVMVTPPFDEGCLAGITLQRLMELIPDEVERSPNDLIIREIDQRSITLEELASAKEVFLTGSSIRVVPIVRINGNKIGDGTPGTVALALENMIANDMEVKEGSPHIAVPYGYASGMRSQLR